MLLLTHIIIATASLVLASLAIVRPSHAKIIANYGLIGATLVSGTLLLLTGAPLLSVCASGLLYTVIAISLTMVARRRLATVAVTR